jgi:hypothetical protein
MVDEPSTTRPETRSQQREEVEGELRTDAGGVRVRHEITIEPAIVHATFSQKVWLAFLLNVLTVVLLSAGWMTLRSVEQTKASEISVAWTKPSQVTFKRGPDTFWYSAMDQRLVHRGTITEGLREQLRGLIDLEAVSPADRDGVKSVYSSAIDRLAAVSRTAYAAVPWINESKIALKPGPIWFMYDTSNELLLVRRPMSQTMKSELLALVSDDNGRASYVAAVERLAFVAGASIESSILILALAGIGGMLGVQLRSMINFIGVTCFKAELDVSRWWAWYWMRPMIGLLLGMLLALLLKTKLFTTAVEQQQDDGYWWLAIAVLAGFGASEFTDRLRLLAKTLFGEIGRTDTKKVRNA